MILSWEPLKIEGLDEHGHNLILDKLSIELQSWTKTKFLPGQMIKGVGVDCDHFVACVIDALTGKKRAHLIPRAKQDTALVCVPESKENAAKIMAIYSEYEQMDSLVLQPGDVATTGSASGGEGHVVIAGPGENEIYHASGTGVKRSGLRVVNKHYDVIFRAFRSKDRAQWAS